MSQQRQAGQVGPGSSNPVTTAVLTPLTAAGISIVVPTRNESANVVPLVHRLERVVSADAEIIFVDDSDDDTPHVIAELAAVTRGWVRLLHRAGGHRSGGLGGAVVAGIEAARYPWVVVMDGDLQHPPEIVPGLMQAARAEQADAVVASRYRGSGSADGLSGGFRRLVSGMSGRLARLAFPRLMRVSDPMSGFFAVRREALRGVDLRPRGYKILLEILVRGRIERIAEVPYTFAPRVAGESKASVREGMRFLRHLAGLRCVTVLRPRSHLARVVGFAVAGGSAVVLNAGALWLLRGVPSTAYLLAAVASIQVAIVWNFLVVDRLVMPRTHRSWRGRVVGFWLLNNGLVELGLGLFYGLVHLARMRQLTASVLAICAVFLLQYVVANRWIYATIDSVLPAVLRRAGSRTWNAAQTRIALAFLLTMVAVPGTAALTWNGLWRGGSDVPLLVPLAAAAALAAGRLRPWAGEPDVHDRQVDVLIAGMLMVAAIVLIVVAPGQRPSSSFQLAATVAFLAAATTLLLGTRTATRLRWAFLLPMLAAGLATPPALDRAGNRLVEGGAALLSLPFGGRLGSVTTRYGSEVLVPAPGSVPGTALVGTLICLLVAGLCCFGARPALLRRFGWAATTAAIVAILVVVAAVVAGRFLGPGAFRVAQVPAFADLALATTVAVVVRRWSRHVRARQAVKRHDVPRARRAVLALLVVAVLLGVRALPHLTVVIPAPTVASNVNPTPPNH